MCDVNFSFKSKLDRHFNSNDHLTFAECLHQQASHMQVEDEYGGSCTDFQGEEASTYCYTRTSCMLQLFVASIMSEYQ